MATADSACGILARPYGEDALSRGNSTCCTSYIPDFAAPLEAEGCFSQVLLRSHAMEARFWVVF